MLDYRGIEALYVVYEQQSFEAAAKKLHITQSAVSQRIKGLESHYGEPLLIRTLPYKPTKLGERLIDHFKRLTLLEGALLQEMGSAGKPHLSLVLNRDSLETWFLDLMELPIFKEITLEIIADDQELTLDYFKRGAASVCISTMAKAVPGGNVSHLGEMKYLLVANPDFVKRYFSSAVQKKTLVQAPAIKFDRNDRLHERYLERYFAIQDEEISFHTVPSVRGFKKYALLGYGYGLIPEIDIREELKQKKLISLCPEKVWEISLYWHYWDVTSPIYKKFNLEMVRQIRKVLH